MGTKGEREGTRRAAPGKGEYCPWDARGRQCGASLRVGVWDGVGGTLRDGLLTSAASFSNFSMVLLSMPPHL